jgi:hypothetical protein
MAAKNNEVAKSIGSLLILVLGGYTFIDYLCYNGFFPKNENMVYEAVYKIYLWTHKIRFIFPFFSYVLAIVVAVMTYPRIMGEKRRKRKEMQPLYRSIGVSLAIIATFTYIPNFTIYNVYIWPAIYLWAFYFIGRGFSSLGVLSSLEDLFSRLPKAKKGAKFKLVIPAEKGLIDHPNPHAGTYIEGSQRTGKTAGWVHPMIYQCIGMGYGAFIYDFKGSELDLTKCAYNTFRALHENRLNPLDNRMFGKRVGGLGKILDSIAPLKYEMPIEQEFVLIHYDPKYLSHRVNPIHPDYIPSFDVCLAIAKTFMQNLDRSLIKKMDFWANNGVAIVANTIWWLKENKPEYCTIPHFVTMLLQPLDDIMKVLGTDEDIKARMRPVMGAFEKEAEGQMAGAESSAQLPFSSLYTKEIFWVFSKNEVDLHINDAKNPKILCIPNRESSPTSLAPVIGVLFETVKNLMNENRGYHPILMALDEFPTTFFKDFDFIPATMGSKNVLSAITVQNQAQLRDTYGADGAVKMMAMGSKVHLRTNDTDSARKISEMFGEKDVQTTSASYNSSGGGMSESTRKEKRVTVQMLESQQIGHAAGKIMDTEPELFFTQINDNRIHNLLNIEEDELLDIPHFGTLKSQVHSEDQKLNDYMMQSMIDLNFDNIKTEIHVLVESITRENYENETA